MSFEVWQPGDPRLARSAEPSVARDQLLAFRPADGTQGARRDEVLAVLEGGPAALDRDTRPGHLTASALVVTPDAHLVLLHHAKLRRWLQPGGHTDGDANLVHVAWREATEETGIAGLAIVYPAIDIDIHTVDPPGEDAHLHFDLRFVVLAPPGSRPTGNHEALAVEVVDPDELGTRHPDEGLLRLVRRGLPVANGLLRRFTW